MNTIGNVIILCTLLIGLASCSTVVPEPTKKPTATETSLLTSTSTPEPTTTPSKTPVPPTETSSAPVLQMPSGTLSSDWEGIPIMPDAIAGDGDTQGYTFTIHASADEILKFYERELGKLGWSMFASGQGTTDAVLLIFMKDLATLSVSIVPQSDGSMYVLIVKS